MTNQLDPGPDAPSSRPLTALVGDYHRLLSGLLAGLDPDDRRTDDDGGPLFVLIQLVQHNVHEADILGPLMEKAGSGAVLSPSLARLNRWLEEWERHPVDSPDYAKAFAELRREFERHANEIEALLPDVDSKLETGSVEGLRHQLGPIAVEAARLPDQVRQELAASGWPRPGRVRTLRELFEMRLRQPAAPTSNR